MVDAETTGLLYTLGIGAAVALVCLGVLACVRPRAPTVYQFRRLANRYAAYDDFNGARVGFPSTSPRPGPLGWLGPALAVPEDDVRRRVGLDAVMFLRFVRSQLLSFAVVALVLCAVLWPVYATGGNNDLPAGDIDRVAGLQALSLSNVAVGSGRLWATLVAEYVVAAVFLFFLYRDYAAYADYRREYRTRENPANYAVVVFDIPDAHNTPAAVRDRFELMVPGQVADVVMARDAKPGLKADAQLAKVVAKKERAEWARANTADEPLTRPGTCGALMCWKSKVPAVDHFADEQRRLEDEIAHCGRTAPNANAAIVVFSNKRAASLIAQANQGGNANEWVVSRAGEPGAVHWPALRIPGYQAVWRAVAVAVFVFLLTFFWTVPATAIMGLANLESLASVPAFSWAEGIRDLSPAVVGLVENVLPAIILSVFLALIPTFIRLAVSRMRLHSVHLIDSKTRNYFYIFSIFASFVFVVLGASALNELQAMIDDPGIIPGRLAKTIPSRGLFYASFILLKSLIPFSIMLLNPGRLIVRWILLKLAKTERERRKAEEAGTVFAYFKMYGLCMMISLIGITYSTLAPLVALCATLFYALGYAVMKHNIVYVCHRGWDGGGWDYPGAFYSVIASLIVKQLTMMGVIGLFEGAAQAILAVFPLIATILFGVWCHHRFNRVALHGSLHDQYSSSAKLEEIPARYIGLYRQPGVAVPEYRNLSGMDGADDVYAESEADGYASDTHVKSEHPDSAVGFVPDRVANRADV